MLQIAAAAECAVVSWWLFVTLLLVCLPNSAAAQDRRRTLRSPGLILETGAPTAATTSLVLTRDGKYLLAAGDDKVVRQWPIDKEGKLNRDQAQVFRWAIYREQRGSIYALALSPDAQQQYLAIAGFGLRNGSLCLIDRTTGRVAAGVTEPVQGSVVNRVAFSPSGQAVAYGTSSGTVHLWKPHAGKNAVSELGSHGEGAGWIRGLAYLAEERLISVADDGSVRQWNPRQADAGAKSVESLQLQLVRDTAVSADGRLLAATGKRRADGRWCLEVRSLDDGQARTALLENGLYPFHVAFHPEGHKVAVGVHGNPESDVLYKPVRPFVSVYDLTDDKFQTEDLPKPSAVVDALAFSPDGSKLVVAGGDNYELRVWDLGKKTAADEVPSPGASVWQVALSPDGKQLGFRQQRNDDPPSVNAWGGGSWRVFDLSRRHWATDVAVARFEPILARSRSESGQWVVEQDGKDRFVWRVRHQRTRKVFPLPLDRDRDLEPRCYTFLGARDGGPERLVVGHQWGMSLFSLDSGQGPALERLFVGHQGEVTSVVASADETILISGSRDQTIAAWTLADWPHQRELGTSFARTGGDLVVRDVAAGSPGWEAGLMPGDALLRLASGGKLVEGGVAEWGRVVDSPTPGQELYFEVRRQGEAEPVKMLTTVRQRPLWRFFPTRGQEWVLWRWRDFFYDCSTQGDDLIGWQVNGDVDETPTFTRAEQNRERFHRPDKVDELLTQTRSDPEQVAVPELVQPRVELSIVRKPNGEFDATVEAAARDELLITEPMEVTLWINDYKFRQWKRPAVPFKQTLTISGDNLRSGDNGDNGGNRIIAQAYTKYGVRGDSKEALLPATPAAGKPRLIGLAIGINDYSRAAPASSRGNRWSSLNFAAEDAEAIGEMLNVQKLTGAFAEVRVGVLTDRQASRDAIIEQLRQVAHAVRPDDLFTLFMAGHGWAQEMGTDSYGPASFAFVTPEFDVKQSLQSGLRFCLQGAEEAADETLFELLAKIPCRKLVLLDCCHSGGSTAMIRDLTPSRVGPIVMVACDKDENAWELIFKGHGAFTSSVLETLGEQFDEADLNSDRILNAGELTQRVTKRVPSLIEASRILLEVLGLGAGEKQRPQVSLPNDGETTKLFGKHVSSRLPNMIGD
jgi:WD40 repeat protein